MSFHSKRQGTSLSSAVFPLPVPDVNVFARSGPNLSVRKAAKLAKARVLHILVIALDFLYLGRFPDAYEIGRPPSPSQQLVFDRLRRAIAACGFAKDPVPYVPGRSGPELVASIMQLEHFALHCPELQDPYSRLLPSSCKNDPSLLPSGKHPELNPHRPLDASRLKLSGQGRWPMERFLDSSLYLPFVEPAFLWHNESIAGASVPSFKHEDPVECLKLAKVWDARGLLCLYPKPAKPGLFCRVFQVYKNELVDRQIGDRRLPNAH